MKYVSLFLCINLLNACVSLSTPVSTPVSPQASPSTTPPPETASPRPFEEAKSCQPESSEVRFAVYANPRNLASYFHEGSLDFSMPILSLKVIADGKTQTFKQNTFSLPRSMLKKNLEIQAEGYATLQRPLTPPFSELCAQMYASLSPLSAEEQMGSDIAMESLDLFSVPALPDFLKTDSKTRFSYALIRESKELPPLFSWIEKTPSLETSATQLKTQLENALSKGQMIVLFSNNSSQMGDIYSVLDSARETPDTLILASHKQTLVPYPLPPQPVGDIFNKRLEIKLIQKTSKPVVVDALQAGVGSPKVRLALNP
ncbi:MAG: hypothetical protein AB7I41_12780 [Candidatus Sericytochromatia bacterium]